MSEHPSLQHGLDPVEGELEVERDHDFGAAVANLELDLVVAVERIEIDDGSAGFQYPIVKDRHGGSVGEQEAHLDAGPHTQGLQASSHSIAEGAKLPIGRSLAHEIDARARSMRRNCRIEHVA